MILSYKRNPTLMLPIIVSDISIFHVAQTRSRVIIYIQCPTYHQIVLFYFAHISSRPLSPIVSAITLVLAVIILYLCYFIGLTVPLSTSTLTFTDLPYYTNQSTILKIQIGSHYSWF